MGTLNFKEELQEDQDISPSNRSGYWSRRRCCDLPEKDAVHDTKKRKPGWHDFRKESTYYVKLATNGYRLYVKQQVVEPWQLKKLEGGDVIFSSPGATQRRLMASESKLSSECYEKRVKHLN